MVDHNTTVVLAHTHTQYTAEKTASKLKNEKRAFARKKQKQKLEKIEVKRDPFKK